MLQRLIVARGVFFLVDLGAAVSGMRADCGLSGYCVFIRMPLTPPGPDALKKMLPATMTCCNIARAEFHRRYLSYGI